VGRYERRRPLGRHRCRWEDNIKVAIEEVVLVGMDLIDVTRDRERLRALVNAVMNFWVL
jgi:hypothetical protein